jgi:alpha-tubulin suppressor-like RCC1 family protein
LREEVWTVPKLLEFSEPIQQISVGRKCCLALAESGTLSVVDVDFTASAVVKLTVPDVLPELPSKKHSVVHMAAGWSYAAIVLKGVGLVVWKTDIPADVHVPIASQGNVSLGSTQERNCKARIITRTETIDNDSTDSLDIRGLMVGDSYIVYLTKAGTVHRVNINNEIFNATDSPSSFLLEKFTTTPQLSYLSGSFLHFGLFNTAGDVLIGNRDTRASSPPIMPAGLQHRGVIGLSWGDWHALALCEDGSVFSWGKELLSNGCLGMGYRDMEEARNMGLTTVRNEVSSVEPRRIPGFGGMEDKFAFCVAAAGWHSAALVADFKV